jgi:hypothetical protein
MLVGRSDLDSSERPFFPVVMVHNVEQYINPFGFSFLRGVGEKPYPKLGGTHKNSPGSHCLTQSFLCFRLKRSYP